MKISLLGRDMDIYLAKHYQKKDDLSTN